MPRLARLDAPGVLHHVIIRGIERKPIFRDSVDRDDFIDRLALLVPDTDTRCYAWVLMGNHAHFLFRSGPNGLVRLMQRLLTGSQANEQMDRRYERKRQGYNITRVAERVAELMGIDAGEIFQKGRRKKRAEARGLSCYWCANELGLSQTELSRKLQMTVSGIGYAVIRGETIAKNGKYQLVDH